MGDVEGVAPVKLAPGGDEAAIDVEGSDLSRGEVEQPEGLLGASVGQAVEILVIVEKDLEAILDGVEI